MIYKDLVKSQVHKIRDFLKNNFEQMLKFTYAGVEKKYIYGGVGGFLKILCNYQSGLLQMLMLAFKVGGVKKGQKYAYVTFEWSLIKVQVHEKANKIGEIFLKVCKLPNNV